MNKKSSMRAKSFIATREHHTSELAEDYVELIADLFASKKEVKICDIATHLGVSHVTVIRTLERLQAKKLIEKTEGFIQLTAAGDQLAAFCKTRHELLLQYLIAIGVPEATAEIDVEGMEHHVSSTTMKCLKTHLKVLTKAQCGI